MSEFDEFAQVYDDVLEKTVSGSGYTMEFFHRYKVKEMARRVGVQAQEPLDIYNFGCGVGDSEPFLREFFPKSHIFGSDTSIASVEVAQKKNASLSNLDLTVGGDGTLPFNVPMDLVFTANVFHHIPKTAHLDRAQALFDCLKPGGELFIFEHNPFNPVTKKVFEACEFDQNCTMLKPSYNKALMLSAGFVSVQVNFTLFFPKPLSFFLPLEKYMTSFPLGAQYYIWAKKT